MDEVTTILHHPVFTVRDRSGDLRHPQPVWTFRDAAKLNAPCGKLDKEKNHETLKSGLGPNFDSKEVGRHDLTELPKFQVGDSVLIVEESHEAELGTILAIADDGRRYLVVFENGTKMVFTAESLTPRS